MICLHVSRVSHGLRGSRGLFGVGCCGVGLFVELGVSGCLVQRYGGERGERKREHSVGSDVRSAEWCCYCVITGAIYM